MRIHGRFGAVAAVALTAGLALTACGSSKSGGDAAGSGSSAVSSASASDSASAPASGASASTAPNSNASGVSGGGSSGTATSPATQAASGSGDAATSPATAGAAGGAACRTANLGFGIGPDSGPQAVGDKTAAEVVKLTNKGPAACSMIGFPGVDLKTNAGTISVPREKKTPKLVTLKPGQSAVFDITYEVNNTGGSGVRVETMVITPPNETHSASLAWSEGSLPATNEPGPGVSVDPVYLLPGLNG